MTTKSRNEELDVLFRDWPCAEHPHFHRDGIIDEEIFSEQHLSVLFVMLEGSAADKGNQEYKGADLRTIYHAGRPSKTLTQNLARWTRVLLDGKIEKDRLPRAQLCRELRRIAVINLKKISGGAKVKVKPVREHALRDQGRLRQQVKIIGPDVVVTCGVHANAIFGQVITGGPNFRAPVDSIWITDGIRVLPALHASHRKETIVGVNRIANFARVLNEQRP